MPLNITSLKLSHEACDKLPTGPIYLSLIILLIGGVEIAAFPKKPEHLANELIAGTITDRTSLSRKLRLLLLHLIWSEVKPLFDLMAFDDKKIIFIGGQKLIAPWLDEIHIKLIQTAVLAKISSASLSSDRVTEIVELIKTTFVVETLREVAQSIGLFLICEKSRLKTAYAIDSPRLELSIESDSSHLLYLYRSLHLMAKSKVLEHMYYEMFDTGVKELRSIAAFFLCYPECLPSNITLRLFNNNSADPLFFQLTGIGPIDDNSNQTVARIATRIAKMPDMLEKTMGIGLCYHPEIMVIARKSSDLIFLARGHSHELKMPPVSELGLPSSRLIRTLWRIESMYIKKYNPEKARKLFMLEKEISLALLREPEPTAQAILLAILRHEPDGIENPTIKAIAIKIIAARKSDWPEVPTDKSFIVKPPTPDHSVASSATVLYRSDQALSPLPVARPSVF